MKLRRHKVDPDDAFQVTALDDVHEARVRINIDTGRSQVEMYATAEIAHELAGKLHSAATTAERRVRDAWR